jgi:hypothetical protein
MKLLVVAEWTDPAVLERLRTEGEQRQHSRAYAERMRRRHCERVAVGAAGEES